jgi:hypothetical protein
MHQRLRTGLLAAGIALWLPLAGAAYAQTAGEGSGSEVPGSGAMIKNPEHAEKGGDTDKNPQHSDKSGQRSDSSVSSGSISPSTAPR